MQKIIHLGTSPQDRNANVFCKIDWDGERLSITGVVGPKANGHCTGSCGQIVMGDTLSQIDPAADWAKDAIQKFADVWDEWHLNDLTAGSPAQEAHLAPLKDSFSRLDWYGDACKALEDAGLLEDPNYLHNGKPYRYGSARLKREVPAEVIEYLEALPDSPLVPAWV